MTVTGQRQFELSQRVSSLKPSATLAVSARVKTLRAQGIDVIGFGAGEPDFDTPDAIKQAAIDSLKAGNTQYVASAGDPAARAAIADKLQRENHIRCSADDIVISTGAKHSLYLVFQCLLDPGRGQQVVIPTPAWVSYRPIAELAGGEVVEVPGATDNDFKVTPQQLETALTPDSRVLVFNSPSNPCGTMYTPDEIRELAVVLERYPDVAIVSDEIYEKLIYGGIEHLSWGAIESIADRVITINGMSKAYAMTGWRIGYACAPGGGGTLAKAMTRLQSQMTSCITSFCYPSIIEALANGGDDVEMMRKSFGERAPLIDGLIAQWPDVKCPRPTGAFYVFPDISAYFGRTSPEGRPIGSALQLAEALLEEAKVAVVPGEDFGECARSHIRLSFACSPENIREGCGRIESWLKSLK